MTTVSGGQPELHNYIAQLYWSSNAGNVLLYNGDLQLSNDNETWHQAGQIWLDLKRKSWLSEGKPWLYAYWGSHKSSAEVKRIVIPSGAPLDPPTTAAIPSGPREESSVRHFHDFDSLTVGDATSIQRILIHITGVLNEHPLPPVETECGVQGQLRFSLPNWDLRLAKAKPRLDKRDDFLSITEFTYVIEATPLDRPVDEDQIAWMVQKVSLLLQFVSGGRIGIGPRAGLNAIGQVVWAQWDLSRPDTPGPLWCHGELILTALPSLAEGFGSLSRDPGLEACVDRATTWLIAVNEPGGLDFKIPVVCSGLELLGWSVLQHRQWLTPEDLGRLTAGARTRLLLQWAGIPVGLPADFSALRAWQQGQNRPYLAGPESIFEMRNRIVHPPKKLTDPEWPKPEQLHETFKLATWYLELVLLRIFDYDGEYSSRLSTNFFDTLTPRPVPWRSLASTRTAPTVGLDA